MPDVKSTTPTKGELRDALERICKALGETPHEWPSQDLYKAYCHATNLMDPDEFTERFMGQSLTENLTKP